MSCQYEAIGLEYFALYDVRLFIFMGRYDKGYGFSAVSDAPKAVVTRRIRL